MIDITPFTDDLKNFHSLRDGLFKDYWDTINWAASYSLYSDCKQTLEAIFSSTDVSCTLADTGKFREALALCRVSLENYLYFKILCEAQYSFKVWEVPQGRNFMSDLNTAQSAVQAARRVRGAKAIRVEDIRDLGCGRLFRVVFHDRIRSSVAYWNAYHTFDAQMRFLKPYQTSIDADYIEDPVFLQTIMDRNEGERRSQRITQRAFFTLEAILDLYRLNGLGQDRSVEAINTHYTFLGMFVHPTLKGENIVLQKKKDLLKLLVYLYACLIEIDAALSFTKLVGRERRFVTSADPSNIKQALNDLSHKHSYFWFLWNKPYRYDYYSKWTRVAGRPSSSRNGQLPTHPMSLDANTINYQGNIVERLEAVFTPFKILRRGKRPLRYNEPRL